MQVNAAPGLIAVESDLTGPRQWRGAETHDQERSEDGRGLVDYLQRVDVDALRKQLLIPPACPGWPPPAVGEPVVFGRCAVAFTGR